MMMTENDKKQYNKHVRLTLEVLRDYGFFRFPLDVFALAKKIGMNLIPYSSLTSGQRDVLYDKLEFGSGFTIIRRNNGHTVYDTYYDDDEVQITRQRFTVAHEIKHVVAGDFNKKELTNNDEALADFFARSLLAPQSIVIWDHLESPEEYVKRFNISRQSAKFCHEAVENRKFMCGEKLFDYEIEFLREVKKYG